MNILVVFYSVTGNTLRLAQAIAEGAESRGSAVRLRRVPEIRDVYADDPRSHVRATRDALALLELVSHDDLRWADGVAFGSPTRFGNMAAPLKQFIDGTGRLWIKGELTGKVAAVFTSSSTQHGGQESTLLSMMVPLFHLGFVIQGLPYAETGQMGMDTIQGGSPYGVSSVSGADSMLVPTDVDLELARGLGRRLAFSAGALRDYKDKSESSAA